MPAELHFYLAIPQHVLNLDKRKLFCESTVFLLLICCF